MMSPIKLKLNLSRQTNDKMSKQKTNEIAFKSERLSDKLLQLEMSLSNT